MGVRRGGKFDEVDKELFIQWVDKWTQKTKAETKADKELHYQHWKDKQAILNNRRSNPSEFMIQARNAMTRFVTDAMPYIVLCLFLYFLYMLFTGGFSSGSSSAYGNTVAELQNKQEMLKSQFTGFFGSIYRYFYNSFNSIRIPPQIKRIFNMFSNYKDGGPTVPRTVIRSGRCDNIQWIETSKDGQMGSCESAIRPQDLTWTINPQLNSEFRSGSGFLGYASEVNNHDAKKTTQWLSQWTNNTNVIIPWDKSPETTFFVPQCEEAYFANQCREETSGERCGPNEHWGNGHCCTKANLLVEQGLTCGLKTFNLGKKGTGPNKNNKVSSSSFANITKFNTDGPKGNLYGSPVGSPLFTNIVQNNASSAATAFLGS